MTPWWWLYLISSYPMTWLLLRRQLVVDGHSRVENAVRGLRALLFLMAPAGLFCILCMAAMEGVGRALKRLLLAVDRAIF